MQWMFISCLFISTASQLMFSSFNPIWLLILCLFRPAEDHTINPFFTLPSLFFFSISIMRNMKIMLSAFLHLTLLSERRTEPEKDLRLTSILDEWTVRYLLNPCVNDSNRLLLMPSSVWGTGSNLLNIIIWWWCHNVMVGMISEETDDWWLDVLLKTYTIVTSMRCFIRLD